MGSKSRGPGRGNPKGSWKRPGHGFGVTWPPGLQGHRKTPGPIPSRGIGCHRHSQVSHRPVPPKFQGHLLL